MARAVAAVEPNVMLPPTIGAPASVNFFLAAVGVSGGGKGAADGAAFDAVRFVDHNGRDIEIESPNIGSGEGLARVFRASDPEDESSPRRTRATISVSEIDTLAALAGRQGATLMPELRKAYMGESIGFNNASKTTTSAVQAHGYRLCLTVGVQPENAGPLIDDAKGGTPQRFTWLPVSDPYAPDVRPPEPDAWTVTVPRWGTDRVFVGIPDAARNEIDAHRLMVLRGEAVDPLDGHVMLCRLKVATALMFLEGRTRVSDDDWRLAGDIMAVSLRTRNEIERILAERARKRRKALAVAKGEDDATTDEVKSRAEFTRCADAIVRKLERSGSLPRTDLYRAPHKSVRGHFDSAIEQLIFDGIITETVDGASKRYDLASHH